MHKKILTIFLVLLFVCTTVNATTAKKLSLEFLVENADLIVQATVGESKAAWDSGKKTIWTTVEIEIAEKLKGSSDNTTVYLRGGTVGEVGQSVAGEAKLTKGEDVVLFLWKDAQGRYQVLGMCQGKFKITKNEAGDEEVTNSYAGLTLVDDNGKELDKESDNYLPMKMSLPDFKTKIQSFLK